MLDPDAVEEWQTRSVQIELDGALTRGATIVDFKLDYPGTYLLVDHALFE